MKTVILIPARHASTRYPGKPLVMLKDGAGVSKSLIRRSWEAACAVRGVADVFVATDSDEIRAAAEAFGARVIMTAESCENGTERCADALDRAGLDHDLVVNLQGDAPLTPPWFAEALIAAMEQDSQAAMATPVLQCDAETYRHFLQDRHEGRVGGTTAVFTPDRQALYFSKEVIPYIDSNKVSEPHRHVFHHVGLYAYRPDALRQYTRWTPGPLEALEGLEQLRFLENGARVTCVEVEARGRVFWELNNPGDVARIEAVLAKETQGE